MHARAALVFGLGLLAAGCNAPTASAPSQPDNGIAATNDSSERQGWDRVFDTPGAATQAANAFDLHPGPYLPAGDRFESRGGETPLAEDGDASTGTLTFVAAGPSADTVDTIRFEVATPDPASAEDMRSRAAKVVRDYLLRFGLEAEALAPAITQAVPARGDLAGTPYSIEPSQDALTITFTRNGADAPATSKPQGN